MNSAFGVDHGEIYKGVPKGMIAAAARARHVPGPQQGTAARYAVERVMAHEAGQAGRKTAGRFKGLGTNLTGEATGEVKGRQARRMSRNTLARVNAPAPSQRMPRHYTISGVEPTTHLAPAQPARRRAAA